MVATTTCFTINYSLPLISEQIELVLFWSNMTPLVGGEAITSLAQTNSVI